MPTSNAYADIFKRLLEGQISPQEAETLIGWIGRDEQDPEAKALILAQLQRVVTHEQVSDELRSKMEAILPAILDNEKHVRSLHGRPSILIWIRRSSVAAVLLLAGAGIYLLFSRHHHPAPAVAIRSAAPVKQDIVPGKQGAILTLADGRTVVLDSMGNGIVATQNGSKVLLHNGQLAYSAQPAAANGTVPGGDSAAVAYNSMTTPKGRQFEVTLPDGTKVWLNAASSLHYPTSFIGNSREVDISGEAYFEVAADAARPFLVRINGTTAVQVLGTRFNINAYTDEAAINTTLLEGSVRVVSGGDRIVLQPGQQARTGASSRIEVIANANLEKVMAWKNGIFDFQDATLEEVMRQLKRWYDIDVVYEKGVPKIEFIGKMGRDLSLAEVLDGLQLSKVHFRLEGRQLIVLP